MLKKIALISLAASITFAPAILAPAAAMAQVVGSPMPADPTGHPFNGPVISGVPVHKTSTVATVGSANMSSKKCSSEAKAKGLVGKSRKKFLAECKHGQM